MIGIIDDFGRALLSIFLRPSPDDSAEPLDVWVDNEDRQSHFEEGRTAPRDPAAA